MPARLVRLLAVAIALLVPLQGMSAVMAGQCMAMGHHQGAAAGHGDAHGDSAHDGHEHDGHGHGHDADQADATSAPCGPCAACCASAYIAGAMTLVIPAGASSAPYVSFQAAHPGVQPHRLDRPPLAL
jgi:hypothetical protein